MEAINALEVQNFEKYLDAKDLKIQELEKEKVNLRSQLKEARIDNDDLKRKLNDLID